MTEDGVYARVVCDVSMCDWTLDVPPAVHFMSRTTDLFRFVVVHVDVCLKGTFENQF